QLRYADGSPVLDENGESVFYDKDKGFVTKDGKQAVLSGKLTTADGKIVTASGKIIKPTFETPLSKSQLDGMLYNGKETYVDDNGQLRYADGSPVLDENGESVFYDPNKGFINKDGKKANLGTNLTTADGKLITSNGTVVSSLQDKQVSQDDLAGMTYNGKTAYIDENGQLKYMDGSPVLDENGEAVFYDPKKGFLNAKGENSDLGGKLATSSGDLITSRGTVRRPASDKNNGFAYQEMDRDIAKIAALQNEESASKANSKTAQAASLGKFYLSSTGALLSSDMEPLTLNSTAVLLDDDNASQSSSIAWNVDTLSFSRTNKNVKPIVFKAKKTGLLYNAKGELISNNEDKVLLYQGDNSKLVGANGGILFDNKQVFINTKSELVDETGEFIKDTRNKQMYFDDATGIYNADSMFDMTDGILTDAQGLAISHKGRVLKGTKKVQAWYYNISNLSNGIILRDGKPIYDERGIKLRGVRQIENDQKFLVVTNLKGNIYQGLKFTSKKEKIVLTKKGKVISPFQAFAYDSKSRKIPFAKATLDFEMLGAGLFVSKEGLVFSDRELKYLVLDSRMLPVKFNGRTLVNHNGPLAPIVVLSTNSYGNYLTNIDGSFIYQNGKRIPIKEGLGLAEAKEKLETSPGSLFPSVNADDPIINDMGKFTISSKGVVYKNNSVIPTYLNGVLRSDQVTFSSQIKDHTDALNLPKSLTNIDVGKRFIVVNNNSMLADENGMVLSTDYKYTRNRFIDDDGNVVIKPQSVLESFSDILISNGKVINFKFLTSVKAAGDLKLVGNILVNDKGEMVKKDGKWVYIDDKGVARDLATGEIVTGGDGAAILDKRNGWVNDKGVDTSFDYLETESGKRYNSKAKLTKTGSLHRRANLGSFLFDDEDKVYTKKEKPVVVDSKHLKVKQNGSVVAGEATIKKDGDDVKFTENGIVSNKGEVIAQVTDDGSVVKKGLLGSAADTINNLIKASKSNLQRLREGMTNKTIIAAKPSDVSSNVTGNNTNTSSNNPPKATSSTEAPTSTSQGGSSKPTVSSENVRNIRLPLLKDAHVMMTNSEAMSVTTYQLSDIQSEVNSIDSIANAKFTTNATGTVSYDAKKVAANGSQQATSGGPDGAGSDDSKLSSSKDKAYIQLSKVTDVPENAFKLFRKGDRIRAVIDAPYSTASAQNVFMPTVRLTSGNMRGTILEASQIVAGADDLTLVFGDKFTLPNSKQVTAPGTFAITINPKTGFPGSGAIVNNHFWSKFLRIAPFALIDKWGSWTEEELKQVETSDDGDKTTTVAKPSPKEIGLIVAGEAANEGRKLVQSEIDALTREIALWRGQEVYVIISEDVYVNEDDLY
ncbi:hypothetical protein V6259_12460, partial [Marinomonas sp. TI.3.20]|uniref:hypothetical protein n=1 Tax=Marinomonas sp. TI.3.20 TaxID=3121296 RepID=UPI00311EA5A7